MKPGDLLLKLPPRTMLIYLAEYDGTHITDMVMKMSSPFPWVTGIQTGGRLDPLTNKIRKYIIYNFVRSLYL